MRIFTQSREAAKEETQREEFSRKLFAPSRLRASLILSLVSLSFLSNAFGAEVTYTKGSDGAAAHQFRNPCKVSLKADPGFIYSKVLYLGPRSYIFPITATAAPGWKVVSAKYKNDSGQKVTLQPPPNAAQNYWQFTFPKTCTLNGDARIITVRFATLRQTPSGSPDYQEDIVIDASIVPDLATFDSDGNGLPDQWEIHYFHHLGNDPYGDDEGDGLGNLGEFQSNTSPLLKDHPLVKLKVEIRLR